MFRDLEKARLIIKDGTGLDITYAYDNLVFSEYGVFILQFDDDKTDNFFCYFHDDCIEKDKNKILLGLINAGKNKGCGIVPRGSFNLKQKGEEFEIHFN